MFQVALYPAFEKRTEENQRDFRLGGDPYLELFPRSGGGLLRFQLLPFFFRRAFHVENLLAQSCMADGYR